MDTIFRSVLFDLDGTLRISVPSGMEMFLEYARQLGFEVTENQALEGARWNHWYWAQSDELIEDLEAGDEMILWTRYSQRLLGAVGVTEPSQEQAQAITEQFADYAPHSELNDGALETLAGLKDAGYCVALVSNRRNPLDEVVADLGLDEFFSFTLAAGEIGIWKPDPGILLEAMERGKCEASTSIYVGDNYYADVVCAQVAGLTPVLLDPQGIFPDADCRVIDALPDLIDWLV